MKRIHYRRLRADRITPQVAFLKLEALALLESAVLDIGKSRYSIIIVKAEERLVLRGERTLLRSADGQTSILSETPSEFLGILRERNRIATRIEGADLIDFPVPAGGVGFLGYETVAGMDRVTFHPQSDTLGLPDAMFLFGSHFVIFDHYRDDLIIAALGTSAETSDHSLQRIEDRLFDVDFRAYQGDDTIYSGSVDLEANRETYMQGVEQIREAIVKGDLLQGVLSHRIPVTSAMPPFEAYRRLRRANPSPYLFYLDFTEFVLFGASPEVMVRMTDRTVTIKPIAGTRRRGRTRKEDLDLEQELLADPKERAEHLMLIDLARNDLNRVCKPASVRVPHTYQVERYSHVMHIVSEVEGDLEDGVDAIDLIRASFPAGTVSGAPKIRAMEIVSSLEPVKRGPYAGLVGYFDIRGDFDSCIIIRSVIHKDGVFHVQAGAGIVYDSDPAREFEETAQKARATMNTLLGGGLV